MTARNVTKQLATMEDLAQGAGAVSQIRGGVEYELGKVDQPYAVNDVASMQALDVTIYTRARVYKSTSQYTDYVYDATTTSGITSTGTGFWVKNTHDNIHRSSQQYTLTSAQVTDQGDGYGEEIVIIDVDGGPVFLGQFPAVYVQGSYTTSYQITEISEPGTSKENKIRLTAGVFSADDVLTAEQNGSESGGRNISSRINKLKLAKLSDLKSATDILSGSIVEIIDSGLTYSVVSAGDFSGTPDGLADHYVNGTSQVGVLLIEHQMPITAFGADDVDSETILDNVNSAVDHGVKEITITAKRFTLETGGAVVDLKGASLVCNDSIITSGSLINNGKIVNGDTVERYSIATALSSAPATDSSPKPKALIKETGLIGGDTSVNGEYYSIFSPSTYGGVIQFELSNGLGAAASSGDYGAPWDRIRVVGSWLYREGFIINSDVQASSGASAGTDKIWDLVGKDYSSSDNYSSDGTVELIDQRLSQFGYVEYTIDSGINRDTNVVLIPENSGSGSTTRVTISVNGIEWDEDTAYASGSSAGEIKVIPITLPRNTICTIRVENTSTVGAVFGVLGVGYHLMSDIPVCKQVSSTSYAKTLFALGRAAILGSQVGANIDTVLRAGSKHYGSYHGGDTSSQCRIYAANPDAQSPRRIDITTTTDPTPSNTILQGQVLLAASIHIRYVGVISTTPELRIDINKDFSVNGGCNVNCVYYADAGDVELNQIYTGMHGTDRSLSSYRGGSFGAADNSRKTFPSGEQIYQFSGANVGVKYTPQLFDSRRVLRQNQIRNNINYLKFYYLAVDGASSDSYTFFDDTRLSFGCLYECGESIY